MTNGALNNSKPLSRFGLPLALLLIALSLSGAAALKRDAIRNFLYGVTGEEAAEHQVRGLANWLTGVTRPQPQTADLVPIAYNGVNPFGVNTFLNQEVEPEKRARQLDLIRAAGFKWIRQEFPWQGRLQRPAKRSGHERLGQVRFDRAPGQRAWRPRHRTPEHAAEMVAAGQGRAGDDAAR